MKIIYVYPKFSQYDFVAFRLGGAGLGNLLFPWARSTIAAKKYNLQVISPTWPSIKVGPLLRSENDARYYSGMFNPALDSIKGLKKAHLLIKNKKYPEEIVINNLLHQTNDNSSKVIVFEGLKNYFEDIIDDHEYVREQLLSITKPDYKKALQFSFKGSVSLHIRLGDFLTTKQETNLLWFANIIKTLKKTISSDLKFYLFSDGSDEQLVPLLQLGNVERLTFGSSIADMLGLSQSKVLFASKGSTFSMWGAYLGRMLFIQPSDGKNSRVYGKKDFGKQIQWNTEDTFPELLLQQIREKLKENSH